MRSASGISDNVLVVILGYHWYLGMYMLGVMVRW
jgi:hypothetical protein